jgi:hypothetical protein
MFLRITRQAKRHVFEHRGIIKASRFLANSGLAHRVRVADFPERGALHPRQQVRHLTPRIHEVPRNRLPVHGNIFT